VSAARISIVLLQLTLLAIEIALGIPLLWIPITVLVLVALTTYREVD